jgi:hypothetical protein
LTQAKPFFRRHFPNLLGFSTNASQTNTRRNPTYVLNGTTISTPKDIPLAVFITGGKSKLGGDADSQRAILDEDSILVRSEINVEEKFSNNRRDVL